MNEIKNFIILILLFVIIVLFYLILSGSLFSCSRVNCPNTCPNVYRSYLV